MFSTFAGGFPGIGLFLQRLVTAGSVMFRLMMRSQATAQPVSVALQLIEATATIFLLLGLWTPLAGAIVAGGELWLVFSTRGEFWLPLVLATLGATLAMIGPGAWSIDALLFGRKKIKHLPR